MSDSNYQSERPFAIGMSNLFAFITLLVVPHLAWADTLSLDKVIAEVLANNSRVAASRQMEQSAHAAIAGSAGWPDPMFMIGIQNTPTDFKLDEDPMTMRMVGLSQDIPYSGYLGLQRMATRASARASQAQRALTELTLVTAAKRAYIDLYYKQQIVEDYLLQHTLMEEVVESATIRLRANQASQEEVLAAQAGMWRHESQLLSAAQQVSAAWFELCALRGVAPVADVPALAPPGSASIPTDAAEWIDSAKANYPGAGRLRLQADSYRYSAAAQRRMTWPMLNLQAEYGFRSGRETDLHGNPGEERDDMVSFQATITLPLFSRGRLRGMARSMESMRQSSMSEAIQIERDTEAAIHALFQRAARLQESIRLYTDQIIPAAEDAFDAAVSAYTANRTNLGTVQNYQVALIQDRSTLRQLEADLATTVAEVERFTTDPEGLPRPASENGEGK